HRQGTNGRYQLRDGVERNHFPSAGADVEKGKLVRIVLEFRQQFYDDVVLIVGRVYGADLAGTVRGIESIGNLSRRQSQCVRFIVVDFHGELRVLDLQVAGNILQLRKCAESTLQLGRILVELRRVGRLQRVLVLRLGQRSADADGGRNLHEDVQARNLRHFRTKFLNHLHRAHVVDAIFLVPQPKEDATLIDGIADRRHGVHDAGIEPHNIGYFLLQLHHVLKCNSLLRFGKREDQALIFVRNESGLRNRVQIKRQPDHHERHHQGCELVPQDCLQAAVVTTQPAGKNALAEIEEPSVARPLLVTEKPAAEHRSQGERYESRNQDRGADRHREFMQQTSDDSTHEQKRNKDGGQRQRHRENGEANLAGAIPRGL